MERWHTGRMARLARRRRDDHDSARYERSQKDACVDDHLSHQDRQADQTRADQRKEYGSRKCTARPVALRLRRVFGRAGGSVACLRPTVSILITSSEEHTSELQSLMRTSYAASCLKTNTPISAETVHATPDRTHY